MVGRSPARVALGWLRPRLRPIIPIIGARKADQLADNMAVLDLALTPDQVAKLDSASKIELRFHHDWFGKPKIRTLAYGGMRDKIDA